MTLLIQIAVLVAALVFITVSAAMNALFLSSLGRTPVEVSLLAAVSIAADIAKAVLPVLLARAILLRAWGYAAATMVMLVMVVALSLASGTGFAAMTRGAVTAEREARSEQLARRRQELAEIEARIAGLGVLEPLPLVEAQVARLHLDRRWAVTKFCTDVATTAARSFCEEAVKLQGLQRNAELHGRLREERRSIMARIEALENSGALQMGDQQVAALAKIIGLSERILGVIAASSVAVTLELGSILLVLLASGPMLRGWREPGTEPPPAAIPVSLPAQADRSHWQRQRSRTLGTIERGSGERRENA